MTARDTRVIDVSKYQGDIDYPIVLVADECDAVISKLTDGLSVDEKGHQNFRGASAVRMLLGTYHFAQPDPNVGDAAAEARHYIAQAKLAGWDGLEQLTWWLDIEQARRIRAGDAFTSWCREFVTEAMDRSGQRCGIYTGGPFWDEHDGAIGDADANFFAAECPLWLAAYVDDPAKYIALTPWRHVLYVMHQWAGDVRPGGKPGIAYAGINARAVDTSRSPFAVTEIKARFALPRGAPPVLDPDDGTAASPLRADSDFEKTYRP